MILNRNSQIVFCEETKPIQYAVSALYRDMKAVFTETDAPGDAVHLVKDSDLAPECFCLQVQNNELLLTAADTLGFVYSLFEISRRFLGVQPFWFWNDQKFIKTDSVTVPQNFTYESKPARVRYRGWFVNDETLISHWKVERRSDLSFAMVFETLLRLGGNLVIPGTGENGHRYHDLAADMGLIITHHHAEPLGAKMFAQAYPKLEPKFSLYPEKFRALWQDAIDRQKTTPTVWNIGFRGQGDKPFWEDDPQYDTPEKRGALISRLIREQYALVKQNDPHAICCTNLYGETMELYQQGCLDLPEDVIKIWADNGFGKMVSRRQGNANPRVTALPPLGDTGAHGLYYHASFYDLQAASHITMLPSSAEFVCEELTNALARGVDDYWLINCSNVKPHAYLLDYIAKLWQTGSCDPEGHRLAYAQDYYGKPNGLAVAKCLAGYADHAVLYGEHPDDHAGDQFYNHVPRMLMTQFIRDRTLPCEDLQWLCDRPALSGQAAWCAEKFREAEKSYGQYLRQCEATAAAMTGAARVLFQDTLLLQAQLYALWAQGGAAVCAALEAGYVGDWQHCFYQAGRAKNAYTAANAAMRSREHGKWIDFYANECQTDIKQSAQVCGYLMSFARTMGEGPHYYAWMREFGDSEADRRVMLILNTENHPDDDALWRLMEQHWGE